jgi:signal transduction histidine kinase
LPEDSPSKPTLNRSLELMRQVIEEGRNAVRGLRSSRSPSLDLEDAFARIQEELNAGGTSESAEFRVIIEGRQRALNPLLRDEIYRIGREGLTNAFRHSGADRIDVELEYGAGEFRLLVRDNGCGIDPQILRTGRPGHWGLLGMRERADRMGARLHVLSGPGAGTEIHLSVPGRIAYQDRPPRRRSWFPNSRDSMASPAPRR